MTAFWTPDLLSVLSGLAHHSSQSQRARPPKIQRCANLFYCSKEIVWGRLDVQMCLTVWSRVSYLFPLWSPSSCLQPASGNKEMSAHGFPPQVRLWHSGRTSCLLPSTSASPVWPSAGSLRVRSCSPCTCPPSGNSRRDKSLRGKGFSNNSEQTLSKPATANARRSGRWPRDSQTRT